MEGNAVVQDIKPAGQAPTDVVSVKISLVGISPPIWRRLHMPGDWTLRELHDAIQVASKINPRQMAEILAQMSPDVAEHLTVELASRAQQVKVSSSPADLPKIQGQPTK